MPNSSNTPRVVSVLSSTERNATTTSIRIAHQRGPATATGIHATPFTGMGLAVGPAQRWGAEQQH
jgi:hypothetical protein